MLEDADRKSQRAVRNACTFYRIDCWNLSIRIPEPDGYQKGQNAGCRRFIGMPEVVQRRKRSGLSAAEPDDMATAAEVMILVLCMKPP